MKGECVRTIVLSAVSMLWTILLIVEIVIVLDFRVRRATYLYFIDNFRWQWKIIERTINVLSLL